MFGSTDFNPVGVQNYPLWVTGVAATAQTLKRSYYVDLVSILHTGKPFLPGHKDRVIRALSIWAYGVVCPAGLRYGERVLELGRALI